MVEKNAVAGVHVVCFPEIDCNPVRIKLGYAIWAPWIERCLFALWGFNSLAVKLACRGIVKPCFPGHAKYPYGLQCPQSAKCVGIGSVFRNLKGDLDMALRCKIVNFIRLCLAEDFEYGR